MPMFWAADLTFPSGGVKGSRANGLEAKSITITKNTTTLLVTAATYGISARYRAEVSHCASEAKVASTTAQKSSEPFCPAQNAETM
jgi:hypothetical protein